MGYLINWFILVLKGYIFWPDQLFKMYYIQFIIQMQQIYAIQKYEQGKCSAYLPGKWKICQLFEKLQIELKQLVDKSISCQLYN